MTITSENDIHDEIERRIHWGNACCFPNLLTFILPICLIWAWNLDSHITERMQMEMVWEQSTAC